MAKPIIAPTIATPPSDVASFIKEHSIDEVYPDQIKEIETALEQRWKNLGPKEISSEKDKLLSILKERRKAERIYNNAKNRHDEIREFETGEVSNMQSFLHEIRACGLRPLPHEEVPALAAGLPFGSPRSAIDWLKNNERPIVHNIAPNHQYRNLVQSAINEARDELSIANKKFFTFANEGRDATPQEIEKSKTFSPAFSYAKRNFSTIASPAFNLGKELLRGPFYNKKVEEDSRFHSYQTKKQKFLSYISQKIACSYGPQQKIIQKLEEVLNSETVLDPEQFDKIQQQLVEEIKKIEGIDQKEFSEVNKTISDLNKKMIEEMGEGLKKEDNRHFTLAIQAALLITPLAGFSVIGFAGGIFAPMFTPGLTFGQSTAGVIANIPVLGDLFHLMKLDYAIGWLLDNTPVVNNITDVLGEVTNNTFTDGAFSILAPALYGTLFSMVAPALFYGTMVDPIIGDFGAVDKIAKNHKEELKSQIEAIGEDKKYDNEREKIATDYQDKIGTQLKELQFEAVKKEINTLSNKEAETIFSNLKIGGKDLFTEFDKDKSSDHQQTVSLIKNDEILYKEIIDRLSAYKFLGKDLNEFQKQIDEIPNLAHRYKKQQSEEFEQELSKRLKIADFLNAKTSTVIEEVLGNIKFKIENDDKSISLRSFADLKEKGNFANQSSALNFLNKINKSDSSQIIKESIDRIERYEKNLTPSTSPKPLNAMQTIRNSEITVSL